jgi:hypothetical protein
LGAEDDLRGDGYLQAYSRLVAKVPWVPIIGNHEYYDGDNAYRWLNQTNFVPLIDDNTTAAHGNARDGSSSSSSKTQPFLRSHPQADGAAEDNRIRANRASLGARRPGGWSTATRALGHTLAPSMFMGMADVPSSSHAPTATARQPGGNSSHGTNLNQMSTSSARTSSAGASTSTSQHPRSNTSRFFSVDLGLGHFIALDGNVYTNKLDRSWMNAQLKWLEADLVHYRPSSFRCFLFVLVCQCPFPVVYCCPLYTVVWCLLLSIVRCPFSVYKVY